MKAFVWNDEGVAAADDADFAAFRNEAASEMTEDGKFSLSNVIYVPKIGQLQFTVRYNNSTLKALVTDYELDEAPTGEPFIYILRDGEGNIYREYEFTFGKRNIYNFRRLVFTGLDMSKIDSLTVDIYYINAVNFDNEPYGSFTVYTSEAELAEYEIKGDAPQKTEGLKAGVGYFVNEENNGG